ncbi:V-SNARE protein,putative [Babesia bigemina]|uniref:V-SNARE protein,putative n=1 Tax=Babesia bigemina TaxID=5866 RepID=A0A061D3X4_BABBI|nr:V-SNARE protein,putative [Babesia bigemina]CDR95421.1 V-SNARE protein,putative [Babesia bigemina]|eukprot:XP_012767607.1 V-SNARE protein,putative [Babesia bigemina]
MAIYQCEDELDRLLLQLKASLHNFEQLDEQQQSDRFSEALLLIERAKVAEVNYQQEIDVLKAQTKQSHLMRLHEKQQKFKELKDKLAELRTVVEQNELNQFEKLKESGHLTHAQKLIAWGDDIQDKTQSSINRMRTLTITSEKLGAEVTQDLERQTESLYRVGRTINAVEENVVTANATLKQIAKGILRERLVQILIALTVLMAIATVLLIVYRGNGT